MNLIEINRLDQLEPLAAEIARLAETPFRDLPWISSWWEAYGGESEVGDPLLELYCAALYDDTDSSRMIGFAPFCRRTWRQAGRVLRLVGSGEVCSDYLGIASTPDDADRVGRATADWLDAASHEWDAIELDGILPGDATTECFLSSLHQAGHAVYRRPDASCWTIDLPSDWESLLARLSKSHRKQVRRAERRIFDSGQAVLRVADDPAALEHGFALFRHFHTERRHSLGQPGCFDSPRFARFLERAACRMFSAGQFQLTWLQYEGRPIAADFLLQRDGVMYAYQGGFLPAEAERQPGWLLSLATLRWAVERGYRRFDFLRGDEPYKAHWRAEPTPLQKIRVVSRHAHGSLRHGIWLAGQKAKAWVSGNAAHEWYVMPTPTIVQM